MTYQALARTWRPRRFSDLVGQQHVVRALTHALEHQRLHQALLFSGTRGVGKTTIGRILAKCLNCERGVSAQPCTDDPCTSCREIDEGRFLDLIEVDAASRTGVDDTRELLDNVQYAPSRGRTKVYLIDEVHMLSRHAFNALLKTLEEPPSHVQFLLATTDPQKLPITILSRCLQFPLKRLPSSEISQQLRRVLAAESIDADDDAVMELSLAADGSMRDALSLLDQAIAFGGGSLKAREIHDMLGTVGRGQLVPVVSAIADGDGSALMAALDHLDQLAPDYGQLLEQIAAGLHCLSVIQFVPEAEPADAELWRPLADRIAPVDVQIYYDIAIAALRDLDWAPDPRTGVEMACLRMLAFRPEDAAAGPPPTKKPRARSSAPQPPSEGGAGMQTSAPADPQTPSPDNQAQPNATDKPVATEQPPRSTEPEAPPGRSRPSSAPALTQANWVDIVQILNLQGAAQELARNSVCREAGEGRVAIELPDSMQFLATANARKQMSDALDAVYERVALHISFGDGQDGDTAAARSQREAADVREQARRAIEDDPNVQQMRERLGAELIEDSIKPEQQR